MKNICYLNLDLYHYFLGRDDQSVNEKVLMKRIDQQIKVTKLVSDCVNLGEDIKNLSEAGSLYDKKYLYHDGNFFHPSAADWR